MERLTIDNRVDALAHRSLVWELGEREGGRGCLSWCGSVPDRVIWKGRYVLANQNFVTRNWQVRG